MPPLLPPNDGQRGRSPHQAHLRPTRAHRGVASGPPRGRTRSDSHLLGLSSPEPAWSPSVVALQGVSAFVAASSWAEWVSVFPEGAEPVGEREVQESHLGLEAGILDGAILAWVEQELEVPVLEADLPEVLDLFHELGPAGGTESTDVQ